MASMLVASVGSLASSGALGRVAVRAALLALALVAVTAVATVMIATPVLGRIHIDQDAAMALRGPIDVPADAVPSGAAASSRWCRSSPRSTCRSSIGILLAVDTIPDMFRSAANATGSMTLAAVLRRRA